MHSISMVSHEKCLCLVAAAAIVMSGCAYDYYAERNIPGAATLDFRDYGVVQYLYLNPTDCSQRKLVLTRTREGSQSRVSLKPNKEIAVGIVGSAKFSALGEITACKMMFSFTPLPDTEYAVDLRRTEHQCSLSLVKTSSGRTVALNSSDPEHFVPRNPLFNWQERDPACSPR